MSGDELASALATQGDEITREMHFALKPQVPRLTSEESDEPGCASVALVYTVAYQRCGDGLWYECAPLPDAGKGLTWVQLHCLGAPVVLIHDRGLATS